MTLHFTKKEVSHTANLVTFTEEILNEKLHILCSAIKEYQNNPTNQDKICPQLF